MDTLPREKVKSDSPSIGAPPAGSQKGKNSFGQTMHIHMLRRTQILPGKPEEVFPFFEKPENLALLTPTWLRFRMQTPSPVVMKEGALIDYTISWLGLPMRWKTRICLYRPPMQFVDEQIKGPYSFWHHTHTFSPVEGGTLMVDEVRYALPLGPAGDLVHRLLIRNQLDKIFDFRARTILEILGHGPGGTTTVSAAAGRFPRADSEISHTSLPNRAGGGERN